MQGDSDPENEIAAYGSLLTSASAPQRQPFILDYDGAAVGGQLFEKASAEAREIAQRWAQSDIMAGAEAFLLVLATVAYYAFFGAGVFVVRRKREPAGRAVRVIALTLP